MPAAPARLLLVLTFLAVSSHAGPLPGSAEVAVCVSGHVRTLVQPEVAESLKHNVVSSKPP